MNSPIHPTREKLSTYLLGTLSPDEVAELAEHIETCADCDTTLEELEELADSFLEPRTQREGRGVSIPSNLR